MKSHLCLWLYLSLSFGSANLSAFMPGPDLGVLNAPLLKKARLVVYGEVRSLELLDAFQLTHWDAPRKTVKIGVSVINYWKPSVLDSSIVYIFADLGGAVGPGAPLLSAHYYVAVQVDDNGSYYADYAPQSFGYAFGQLGEPHPNLTLINETLGQPKTGKRTASP